MSVQSVVLWYHLKKTKKQDGSRIQVLLPFSFAGKKAMNKPLRPCRHAGCRRLTRETYCEEHRQVHAASRQQDRRVSSSRRGYGSKWRKERALFLLEHPWCVDCQKDGKREPATEVDHKIPHKGDPKLFWDKNNWQGLCHACHSRKTALEDGGFGRSPRGEKVSKNPR